MSRAPQPPIEVALEVDCRGLFCPLPVQETQRALERLDSGQVVRVRCTDPASTVDLAALCARSGDALLRTETSNSERRFLIRKR